MAEALTNSERIENLRDLMKHPAWRELEAAMKDAWEGGRTMLVKLTLNKETQKAELLATRLDFIERFLSQPLVLMRMLTQPQQGQEAQDGG